MKNLLVALFWGFTFTIYGQDGPMIDVFLPVTSFDKSTPYTEGLLHTNLSRIFSQHSKVTLAAGDANFRLKTSLYVVDKSVTSSAPPMVSFKLDLGMQLAGLGDKIFASSSITLRGVGENENEAYANAFKNIKNSKVAFHTMIDNGFVQVQKYYEENCDRMLLESQSLIAINNYQQALKILFSIPSNLSCYSKAMEVVSNAYKKKQNEDCAKYLSVAETAFAMQDYSTVTEALIRIDPEAECSAQAQALIQNLSIEVKGLFERKWSMYEGKMKDNQQLEHERVQAMKEAMIYVNNQYASNQAAANQNAQNAPVNQQQVLNVSQGTSRDMVTLSDSWFTLINPASGNSSKVYLVDSSLNVFGFIKSPEKSGTLIINGIEVKWDSKGIFKYHLPLKIGDNLLKINLKQEETNAERSLSVIRAANNKGTTGVIPAASSLVPIKDQKRFALVIGNANYTHVAPLKNTKNDAAGIQNTLKSLGFEVETILDASYEGMRKGIINFSKVLSDADVALFYYAGHGLEMDGQNFLVPVDAKIETKQDVFQYSIDLENILKPMKYSNAENLNILILDACRNNPFPTGKRGGGGLARVTPPSGMLIAYATEPGATASDGEGQNGLYTGELIRQMKVAQRIEDVFMNTRNQVEEKSGGQQQPWEEARLKGVFYLAK